ncbi:hypothetical protein IBT54_003728 [Pantoea sp. S62]|nr:hypothetical protein [Pantoea sp. S62]
MKNETGHAQPNIEYKLERNSDSNSFISTEYIVIAHSQLIFKHLD